ncbi:uncharacterized protein LOC108603739 [Drosophila busckii]|uniref:uncharacterized protein LOC108603739 n=1 Tax=Drosophila busckii TaxID=30019 RepID=UPI00083EE46B|nr:uncharacterized protein LOC108603739 [Drosophila busckii]
MIFKINLFAGNADITINYEGKTLTKMTLDPKKPPSVCLPVVSKYTPLDLCVKFNAKLDGLTDMKICSVLYCSNDGKQIMQYDFPCIKAGANGVSMA